MSKLKNMFMVGLSLLAVETTTIGHAYALPSIGTPAAAMGPVVINKKVLTKANRGLLQYVANGSVEVGTVCGGEFFDYAKKKEFYERPSPLCVKWSGKKPVEWARWELWKDNATGEDTKIASSDLPANMLTSTSASFVIQLSDYVPLYNNGDKDQRYFVKVKSKNATADDSMMNASQGTLVHKFKAGKPVPPPDDPFACSSNLDSYKRKVVLEIPKMTVNKTTSTSGDGDRDELYISIGQLGPGTTSKQTRLPKHPDNDDYFEAMNGATVGSTGWTNQDQDIVPNPKLFNGTVKHGQVIDLFVSAQEQDNSDLKDIRSGLIDAMTAVAAAAAAAGGAYGAIIAAVAGAVAAGSSFIPQTKNHDFIGLNVIRITNKCGYIQTVWTTFESQKIDGVGTLSNQFLDVETHEGFVSRAAVVALPDNMFHPNGIDYGAWEFAGATDQFWWIAKGTSGSKYTFLLKETVSMP